MDNGCPECEIALITQAIQAAHISISRLTGSELFKCRQCNAYLLHENRKLELLQPGCTTTFGRPAMKLNGSHSQSVSQ